MWEIILVHMYGILRRTLINKLFFRGRFISKIVRLLLGRLIRFVANNYAKVFMVAIFLSAMIYLIAEKMIPVKIDFQKNSLVLILVSAFVGYLVQFLPKKTGISGRVMPYDSIINIEKYNRNYSYQYYILPITNQSEKTIILEKLFLTNGNFVKNYDVVFINSGGDLPVAVNKGHYPTRPAVQAVLKPNETMYIKFASYLNFKYAVMQDSDMRLYKIQVATKNWRSEYDINRRAMFTTKSDEIKQISDEQWLE
ncbi:hypothetical protein [Weissella confusa]|uniref:hypothetical protein n=7 Tax=Weissella confusa TaxID=1583 RepID=UPI00108146ED|nr:hypothetical protein [Weissella confusa]MBJ7629305.1 hypothetical protein [Weissella confusa]MCT0042721.1 hypothetical protein [Weissella confusa]TGE48633.1 hypothetical protein C6P23_04595 [Weissella confusa]TGE59507.1 hypothetical protein C6P19_04895 [Weissella confusa]